MSNIGIFLRVTNGNEQEYASNTNDGYHPWSHMMDIIHGLIWVMRGSQFTRNVQK